MLAEDLGVDSPNLNSGIIPDKDIESLQTKANEANDKAKACGVDLARRGFMNKLCSMVMAGAAPLVALTGASFLMAAGDVYCAYKDWQCKAEGKPSLPMEADSVGNAMHWLAKKCGADDTKAKTLANYGSASLRPGVSAATILTGYLDPHSVAGAAGVAAGS